jgi:hypothetical protein
MLHNSRTTFQENLHYICLQALKQTLTSSVDVHPCCKMKIFISTKKFSIQFLLSLIEIQNENRLQRFQIDNISANRKNRKPNPKEQTEA